MGLEPLERNIATFVGFCVGAYGYFAFANSTARSPQVSFTIGDTMWATVSFGMICAFGHAIDAFALLGLWPWTLCVSQLVKATGMSSRRRIVESSLSSYSICCVLLYVAIIGDRFIAVRFAPWLTYFVLPSKVLGMGIQSTKGPTLFHPLTLLVGSLVTFLIVISAIRLALAVVRLFGLDY